MSVLRRAVVASSVVVALAGSALAGPSAASAEPAGGAAAAAAAGAIVVNGSFETPPLPFRSVRYTKAIKGWTAPQGFIAVENNVLGPAADGAQYVELDSTRVSWIQQIVTLPVPTQQYAITFRYAGHPGANAKQNSFLVQLNGTITQFSVDASSDTAPVWRSGQVTFTANASEGTLRFIGLGPSDERGALIDDVSVTPVVG